VRLFVVGGERGGKSVGRRRDLQLRRAVPVRAALQRALTAPRETA